MGTPPAMVDILPCIKGVEFAKAWERRVLRAIWPDLTVPFVSRDDLLAAKLAALVPPPHTHLTRYHGVFAPHSKLRAAVTPADRGVRAPQPSGTATAADPDRPPTRGTWLWAGRGA
jgi:hypothetical protein